MRWKSVFLLMLIFQINNSVFSQKTNLDSLEQVVVTLRNDTSKVILLNEIAYKYYRISPKKCLKYATQGAELSTKIRYKKGLAVSYGNIGLYHGITDNYLQSIDEYELSLKCYQEIGDKDGIAKTLGDMGVVYQFQRDYSNALDLLLQALELEMELGDKSRQASTFGNLGNLYDEQGEYKTALKYYNKSLELIKEIDSKENLGIVYGNIGLVYFNQENYKIALEYFTKALHIDSLENNKFALSDDWGNVGLTYSRTNNFNLALASFQNALDIDEEMGNKDGIAFDLAGFSRLYLNRSKNDSVPINQEFINIKNAKEKNLKTALEFGLRAEKLYKEINKPNYGIYNTIKEIYLEKGDLKNALINSELYWKKRMEIFSSQKARDFARFEAAQEHLKNKNQIKILENQNTKNYILFISTIIILLLTFVGTLYFFYQLKQKRLTNKMLEKVNSELELAIDSKDKFLSIIAHDLINPIGGMASALRIFKRERNELPEAEVNEYVDTLVKTADRTNDLLTNLLEWSRIQKGLILFQPTLHDINPIIKSNIQLNNNLALAKGITISFAPKTKFEFEFDDYMINSVLGNILFNAIKFTQQNGFIKIDVEHRKNWIDVSIEDNGVGMTEIQQQNLFDVSTHASTIGTNQERGTGLGLILCKEFVELHHGEIKVKSSKWKGTCFTISLPLKTKKP